jgi:hypothetical protein
LFIDKKTISPPVLLQAFSVALTNDSYGPNASNLEHLSLNGRVCKHGLLAIAIRTARQSLLARYSELGN